MLLKLIIVLITFVIVHSESIAKINCTNDTCKIENGYVELIISFVGTAFISSIKGDFHGTNFYGTNLLSKFGYRLERIEENGAISTAAGVGNPSKYTYSNIDGCISMNIMNIIDAIDNPIANESWNLSLCDNQRMFDFTANGNIITSNNYIGKSIRRIMYTTPASITGFFEDGVVQEMNAQKIRSYFGSSSILNRIYMLGEKGSIDIIKVNSLGGENDQIVLMSSNSELDNDFRTGFQQIISGSYDFIKRNKWTNGQDLTSNIQQIKTWNHVLKISPNNFNFPSSSLSNGLISSMDNKGDGNLGSFMTGIYGNSVGCLATFDNEVTDGFRVAQIAPTLKIDNSRGYDGTYNYFDPDSFFSLSSILFSGDAYLQNQVKLVIERSGQFIKEDTGQLPHHFNKMQPYFLALSGETQTGPNTFWVKTALQYASMTGDYDWLSNYMPRLRLASSFVFDLIEKDTNMLLAPGSLMIDVFIRNNYTSDSNAMVVGFLRDFAIAERIIGNETRAIELETIANDVIISMNSNLWADKSSGNDHYITQLNKIDGSIRDFVDYDSNLIAIANGVSNEERSRAIFRRIDSGRCSASMGAGAQFVSEIYYGPNDTTNGNTGDSWCSMARIGWFDAVSRQRFGTDDDLKYFNERILNPIQNDLIKYTWLHERYACDGTQQENRTMYYFEYPALVSILNKEIRYGVKIGLNSVLIDPFKITSSNEIWEYNIGNIHVLYSQEYISIYIIGLHSKLLINKEYKISHLYSLTNYKIEFDEKCNVSNNTPNVITSSIDGILTFSGPTNNCNIYISKVN